VTGKTAERLAAMSDLSTLDGVLYFQQRLDRLGVTAALETAGARAGRRRPASRSPNAPA